MLLDGNFQMNAPQHGVTSVHMINKMWDDEPDVLSAVFPNLRTLSCMWIVDPVGSDEWTNEIAHPKLEDEIDLGAHWDSLTYYGHTRSSSDLDYEARRVRNRLVEHLALLNRQSLPSRRLIVILHTTKIRVRDLPS